MQVTPVAVGLVNHSLHLDLHSEVRLPAAPVPQQQQATRVHGCCKTPVHLNVSREVVLALVLNDWGH